MTPASPGYYWYRDPSGQWLIVAVTRMESRGGALMMWSHGDECEAPLPDGDDHEWGPRIPEPHHHPDSRWWAKQIAEALDHVEPGCAEGIEDNADGRRLAVSLIEGLEPQWRRAHAIADIKALRITHDPGETEARRAHVISWTNAIDAALAILRGEKPKL